MNKLIAELQRLYFLHEQQWISQRSNDAGHAPYPEEATATLDLVSTNDRVRTMVVGIERPSDWERMATLFQAIQEDLELPAPAIAISGSAGFQLWLSLAEPVSLIQAHAFLTALRLKYLADIRQDYLKFHPTFGMSSSVAPQRLDLIPTLCTTTERWSAFIDPSLGSMFAEESGLAMAPNWDGQAALLSGLKSIKVSEFERALNILQIPPETSTSLPLPAANKPGELLSQSAQKSKRTRSKLTINSTYSDPKSFLLAVMNDPSATAGQRIKAAKALLPYVNPRCDETQ